MSMLTDKEKQFLKDWEVKRLQKKKMFNFTLAVPLGVLAVLAIFANLVTGWHVRATMAISSNTSVILVIMVAAIAIVLFISIFAGRYQWEQNEQRYQELLYNYKSETNK